MNKIVAFGPVEDSAKTQLERCLEVGGEAAQGVLCADHHKGYSMPIGGVLASEDVVMPAGVGYDIGCGNCAIRTNIQAKDIDLARVMDEVWKVISFGVGRKNGEEVQDAPVFEAIAHSPVQQQRDLLHLATQQLGTVGSGNHYVDLLEDRADGSLWIGVHFGSRGFGHKTATGFLALAEGKEWGEKTKDDMDGVPATIQLGTPLADDYLAAMTIAGQYASEGRDWVVQRVLQILGGTQTFYVHNHHNFAWWEIHDGKKVLVVRKGATPAFPGQMGFVGGSMGDDAVIIKGVESEASQTALYSTVHGAGRVMGRRQAAGKTKTKKIWQCGQRSCEYHDILTIPATGLRRGPNNELPTCPKCKDGKMRLNTHTTLLRPGIVDWSSWKSKLAEQGVELRGGGADEAPECYKRLNEVLAYHKDTIEILHTLKPIGVAMAGLDTFDPYKD